MLRMYSLSLHQPADQEGRISWTGLVGPPDLPMGGCLAATFKARAAREEGMRVDTRGAISSILDLALWLEVVTCLCNARSMRLGVGPHCNCLGVVYCHLNQHNSSIRCRKGSISRHISRYSPNYRAGCSLPAQPLPGPS